jgi:organic hydroperoxide reductase OsmC/OhrA
LTSEAVGEIETEGRVLVVRRLHVTYHLRIAAEHRELAQRVHSFHADGCPVARTIRNCVAITTALELGDLTGEEVAS